MPKLVDPETGLPKTYGRVKRMEVPMSKAGIGKKLFKQFEKEIAKAREVEMRRRCIQAAKLIRDEIADSAPKPIYRDLLLGEPLERYYNKNSGYDVRMDAGARFTFVLKLSVNRFLGSQYRGWNPVFGLYVSNYGRAAIVAEEGSAIPIASDEPGNSRKLYDHPQFGTGWGGRYQGKYVNFVKHVSPVQGTHWIENAVVSATRRANNVLSGKTGYAKNRDIDRRWS